MSTHTPDSPNDEVFRTPNTTLESDDTTYEAYSTPIGDFSAMKMKSMNNLLEGELLTPGGMSRMKSLNHLDCEGDTPVDLVKLKREFERKKMQSLTNLVEGNDVVDGMPTVKRHHSDNDPASDINRHSLQTPKIYKRVGMTKYVGADSAEDRNYQIMKMRSMGTINDIANNNNQKSSRNFDPFYNVTGNGGIGKKYDKTFVVPICLDERFKESNDKDGKNGDAFKVPDNPMLALRKEKSSSCIESMKNRGSSIYDRLR